MPGFTDLPERIYYMETLDNPLRLFGDPYLLTKFRGYPICHFDIANLILRPFGLIMPIITLLKLDFWGFHSQKGSNVNETSKRHIVE